MFQPQFGPSAARSPHHPHISFGGTTTPSTPANHHNHHQSHSLRRPNVQHLSRPPLFFTASTRIPSYHGSLHFGTSSSLPRRALSQMSFGRWPPMNGQGMGIGTANTRERDSEPTPIIQEPIEPYCTVEEIKQGKKKWGIKKKNGEENHYEEQDDDEEEEEEEEEVRKSQQNDSSSSSDNDDGYGLYEKAPNSQGSSRPNSRNGTKLHHPPPPPLPPPLPPPIMTNGKGAKNGWMEVKKKKKLKGQQRQQHSPLGNDEKIMFKRRPSRIKLLMLLLLFFLCALLLILPLLLLWLSIPQDWFPPTRQQYPFNFPSIHRPSKPPNDSTKVEISTGIEGRELLVEPKKLAEWMQEGKTAGGGGGGIASRLRIFEVVEGSSKKEAQPQQHWPPLQLPHARPLQIGTLSHNGVPVHPLQFQRLMRANGVDSDSVVILYDRHPQALLAAYALWIFRLYGHDGTFLLNGGLRAWQEYLAVNGLNSTSSAEIEEDFGERRMGIGGTFQAKWQPQFIATFDDVLANFQPDQGPPKADIVDAQSLEEFNGKSSSSPSSASAESASSSVIFGHIRTAVNLPIERLFSPHFPPNRMPSANDHAHLFSALGLSPRRPVILYDGFSSMRAAALWTALHRANYSAALYFGAWPEWLIRAPDHLKIIPDK